MDQLTRDCIAARKAGVSYGKYIASLPQTPAAVRFPKEQTKGQEKRRMCGVCSQPIPERSKLRVYCSIACAEIGRRAQIDEHHKKRRGKK